MRIDAISLGKNPPHEVNVIIEVPVMRWKVPALAATGVAPCAARPHAPMRNTRAWWGAAGGRINYPTGVGHAPTPPPHQGICKTLIFCQHMFCTRFLKMAQKWVQ